MRRALLFPLSAVLVFTAHTALSEILVSDAYARSSSADAPSGAAFMVIENTSDTDDRLVNVTSPVAARVELHTHIADDAGVMRMREIEGGLQIPAGALHELARGGDHVMFMGLHDGLRQGDMVPVTLIFENAGEVVLEIPVDLDR